MSRWFRHYAGMMRDEKLVAVAIKAKQPVERVLWVWGAILESAAEVNDGGRFELDPGEAAYFLRADEADIHAIKDGLTASGRVAENIVVHWGDRQYLSDTSAQRQAAYRERKRAKGSGSDVQENNGDVTPPLRDGEVTPPETETETETDTETDKKVLSETSSDVKPKKARGEYPEPFNAFWKAYPTDSGMSKLEAWKAWEKLSVEDRGHATNAIPAFKAWVARQSKDYRTVHACRYLSQRRFDGFTDSQTAVAAESAVKVIIEGTPEWDALKAKRPRLVARDIPTPSGIVRGTYHYGEAA